MEECLFSFPVAFSLPKHSHFTKAISAKMRAIREAGLVEKWFNDKMDSVARSENPTHLCTESRGGGKTPLTTQIRPGAQKSKEMLIII